MVLIYYIHDLPKQKLLQRKMQFVANEVAAVLQNLAAQKGANVKISHSDIFGAVRLAWLSLFPGMTQYNPDIGTDYMSRPTGYMPMVFIHYVVGTADNNAEIKWNCRVYPNGIREMYYCSVRTLTLDSAIKIRSGTPSTIHPDLHMNKGESKIIVECSLYSDPNIYFSTTKKPTRNMTKRDLFGFLLYNPVSKELTEKRTYFHSFTIFTPNGTAFPDTHPR